MGEEALIAESNVCQNCKTVLSGKFCHVCGQKNSGTRLTVPVFLEDTLIAITEIDSRLWTTLIGLFKNPGRVALEYIGGARARYIGPAKYFLVIFAIYLGVAAISGAQEAFIEAQTKLEGEIKEEQVEQFLISFTEALRVVLRDYINVIVFLALPILAFLFRWQYFRAKRNYAENLVFIAYTFAQGYFYSALIILVQWPLGNFIMYPRYAALLLTFTYSAHVFYGMRWFVTPFAILLSFIIYFFVQGSIGGAFAFAMLWGWI
jgi:hypothetical protein